MFEFDDASFFVMRTQISRETRRSYQELQYRGDLPLIRFGAQSSEHAQSII
jgi:hypothetical protein